MMITYLTFIYLNQTSFNVYFFLFEEKGFVFQNVFFHFTSYPTEQVCGYLFLSQCTLARSGREV